MSETAISIVQTDQRYRAILADANFVSGIQDVLPRFRDFNWLKRMAVAAVARNPDLLKSTRKSICLALQDAAKCGLDPSGALGHGYLVQFWNKNVQAFEAQFMPGYRGLIELARRAGRVKNIRTYPIYENDRYEIRLGTDNTVEHSPLLVGERGSLIAVYAVADFDDGGQQIEVMTVAQIEKVRNASKQGNNQYGPWVQWFDEMARKTVVKRLIKFLPISTEDRIAEALAADDREYMDTAPTAANVQIKTVAEGTSAAAAPVEVTIDPNAPAGDAVAAAVGASQAQADDATAKPEPAKKRVHAKCVRCGKTRRACKCEDGFLTDPDTEAATARPGPMDNPPVEIATAAPTGDDMPPIEATENNAKEWPKNDAVDEMAEASAKATEAKAEPKKFVPFEMPSDPADFKATAKECRQISNALFGANLQVGNAVREALIGSEVGAYMSAQPDECLKAWRVLKQIEHYLTNADGAKLPADPSDAAHLIDDARTYCEIPF